jgi:hypothetical protein
MFNWTAIKEQILNAWQWAISGSKLTYVSIAIGLFIGFVLFKLFFKHVPGLIHCVGFSVSTGKNPDIAAQPGLGTSSRLKLLVGLVIPVACGIAAYFLLPRWFPAYFH